MAHLTRWLACELTDAQLRERGQKLAKVAHDSYLCEEEKKEEMAVFKTRLEGYKRDMSRLCEEINSKKEYRDVPVTEEKDYTAKTACIVRLDTGEIIETRFLSPEEMQRKLRFDNGTGPDPDTEEVEEVIAEEAPAEEDPFAENAIDGKELIQ